MSVKVYLTNDTIYTFPRGLSTFWNAGDNLLLVLGEGSTEYGKFNGEFVLSACIEGEVNVNYTNTPPR